MKLLLFGLLTVAYSAPTSNTGCSPIVPPDSCGGTPWNPDFAEEFTQENIRPKLDSILHSAQQINASLANITEYDNGPYYLGNDSICNSANKNLSAQCISRSIYRMKCEVRVVVDIVKNESLRQLVDEVSNYAPEFQSILNNLDVLLAIQELVSRHRQINGCQVEEKECVKFEYKGRLRVVKSISEDLVLFTIDLKAAFNQLFQ